MNKYKKKLNAIICMVYYFYCNILNFLCKVISIGSNKGLTWTTEKCINILQTAGYDFRPLWSEIVPLQPSSMDLSIIVPVYNGAKYLEKCLLSILEQDTQYSYEVICINDGSTDESLEILERFASQYPNVLKIISQENQGISKARNVGIAMAIGQYVGLIDDDDYISPMYVETLLSSIISTGADLVQAGYNTIDINGNVYDTYSMNDVVLTEKSSALEKEQLICGFPWGKIYKKELFEKIRYPEGFWFEDMLTRVLIMRCVKTIAIVRGVFYHYVYHSANTNKVQTSTFNIKSVDQYWLLFQLLSYQIQSLNLPIDDAQYIVILKEMSYLLRNRTHALPQAYRKAVFCLASEMVNNLNYKSNKALSSELNKIKEALQKKNFLYWNLLSHKLGIQLKVKVYNRR